MQENERTVPLIDCAAAQRLIREVFDIISGRDLTPHEETGLTTHCRSCAACDGSFRTASDAASVTAGKLLGNYSGDTLDEQYEEWVRRSLF